MAFTLGMPLFVKFNFSLISLSLLLFYLLLSLFISFPLPISLSLSTLHHPVSSSSPLFFQGQSKTLVKDINVNLYTFSLLSHSPPLYSSLFPPSSPCQQCMSCFDLGHFLSQPASFLPALIAFFTRLGGEGRKRERERVRERETIYRRFGEERKGGEGEAAAGRL